MQFNHDTPTDPRDAAARAIFAHVTPCSLFADAQRLQALFPGLVLSAALRMLIDQVTTNQQRKDRE